MGRSRIDYEKSDRNYCLRLNNIYEVIFFFKFTNTVFSMLMWSIINEV